MEMLLPPEEARESYSRLSYGLKLQIKISDYLVLTFALFVPDILHIFVFSPHQAQQYQRNIRAPTIYGHVCISCWQIWK